MRIDLPSYARRLLSHLLLACLLSCLLADLPTYSLAYLQLAGLLTSKVRIDLAPYATPTALAVAVRYWSQAIGGAMRIRTARLAVTPTGPQTLVCLPTHSAWLGSQLTHLGSARLAGGRHAHHLGCDGGVVLPVWA